MDKKYNVCFHLHLSSSYLKCVFSKKRKQHSYHLNFTSCEFSTILPSDFLLRFFCILLCIRKNNLWRVYILKRCFLYLPSILVHNPLYMFNCIQKHVTFLLLSDIILHYRITDRIISCLVVCTSLPNKYHRLRCLKQTFIFSLF